MNDSNDPLEIRAKKAFDQSVDGLDAATLSKLNQGRHRALAQGQRPDRRWLRWMPVTGAAAVVLLAVGLLRGPGDVDMIAAPQTSDLEIILGEESIEMFEDLEFYSWLDSVELEGEGDFG